MNKNKKTLKTQKKKDPAKKGKNIKDLVLKKKNGKNSLTRFGKTLVICLSVVLFLTIAVVVSVNALVSYYYGLMDYVDIDKETLLGDDEISKYLDAMDTVDPSVTNTHDSDELHADMKDELDKIEQEKENVNGIFNIMLLGVDNSGVKGDTSTYATAQNTDTMIVVTVNEKTKKIVLTSLMRDSCVQIQNRYGNTVINRLNTAYVYGGYKELFATVERNFGIETNKFVQVDFSSFIDIVTLVGGVDVYVTEAEAVEMNNVMVGINEVLGHKWNADKLKNTAAGVKHLNGKQALAYARIRYVAGSDFGRTERQRKVIMAVAGQLKTLSVTELNNLLTTMLSKVKTNLTQAECTDLMANALGYLNYEMESFRIPADGTYKNIVIEGRQMLSVSFTKNYQMWKELVMGK